MKKSKKIFVVVIGFLFVALQTQSQTIDRVKLDAYLNRDNSKWIKALKMAEKSDLSKPQNLEELIHCYYALTSNLIAKKMRDDAENNIQKAKSYIEILLKKNPNNAVALNYKGVFLGYEIAMNKMKAVTQGNSCRNNINKALQLDPNNPQILFDKGNLLYYPPKIFGGDKKEALKYFQKAIAIYEKQNKTQNNWMYIQLLVIEGHSYELLEQDKLAEKSYLKILKIAPDFITVKNELYPKLKARMSGTSKEKAKEIDYSLEKKK